MLQWSNQLKGCQDQDGRCHRGEDCDGCITIDDLEDDDDDGDDDDDDGDSDDDNDFDDNDDDDSLDNQNEGQGGEEIDAGSLDETG